MAEGVNKNAAMGLCVVRAVRARRVAVNCSRAVLSQGKQDILQRRLVLGPMRVCKVAVEMGMDTQELGLRGGDRRRSLLSLQLDGHDM